MKKAWLFLLLSVCFQHKAFPCKNKVQSKLQFASKGKSRISIDSIYYYQFNAIDSLHNAISFSVESLPGWLRYNKADHSLSGRPVKPGQYGIHIAASNGDTMVHQRFMLTVYDAETVNILTLGNSITNDTNRYNSYRRLLWKLLHKERYNFDFIGSWNLHNMGTDLPDPDFDLDHDGHSGWKASDMLSPPEWDKQRGNLHEWIKTYTPDMVLMELGTNEIFQCVRVKEVIKNITSIIEIIRNKNPAVKIFVAQIPPLGAEWADKKLCGDEISYAQAIMHLNKEIAVFAAEKNTKRSPVISVDQYSRIHAATDLYDDIHPNEKGENKMAESWYKAIHGYLKKLKIKN